MHLLSAYFIQKSRDGYIYLGLLDETVVKACPDIATNQNQCEVSSGH